MHAKIVFDEKKYLRNKIDSDDQYSYFNTIVLKLYQNHSRILIFNFHALYIILCLYYLLVKHFSFKYIFKKKMLIKFYFNVALVKKNINVMSALSKY